MPKIGLEIFCKYCGAGLCDNTEVKYNEERGVAEIHISPCGDCVEKAREEGEKRGYEDGVTAGEERGFEQGEAAAKAETEAEEANTLSETKYFSELDALVDEREKEEGLLARLRYAREST